ncbi:MAG: glutaredoxin family protein [Mycobacteriales bacterium]|jgi:glutaredoxin
MGHQVTLYSRPGCHLCDDAREAVKRIAGEFDGIDVSEVDITTSPQLTARYGEWIPVLFVDGRQHGFWKVDEDRLRTALAA